MAFLRTNEAVVHQTIRSPGFIKGKLLVASWRTYWTLTIWSGEEAMKAYRGSGAHRDAMPKLLNWCDEASVAHWEQTEDQLPTWMEVHRRMVESGRTSKVNHPTQDHLAKRIAPPRMLLERPLNPKRSGV